MTRKKLDRGRPWLLGKNDTPPPMRVPWQMWSQSSNPHQQGLIAFEFTEEGLAVGWYPEGFLEKSIIPWDELAWMSGQVNPDLKIEAQYLKEQAETDGYKLGKQRAVEEIRLKIMKLRTMSDETGNPFLVKYAEALKAVMDEVEATLNQ
jgi:hypothetical protein